MDFITNLVGPFATKQVATTALRYTLVWLGGILATKGLVDAQAWTAQVPAMVATVTAIAGLAATGYGLYTSTRTQLIKRADSLPGVAVVKVPDPSVPTSASEQNSNRP